MKSKYTKPVVKSLTDPKAAVPAALVAAAAGLTAVASFMKAIGDDQVFVRGSTLVDSKEVFKNISVKNIVAKDTAS
ncbi:hypothetical protein [Succinimonas sp.]|uniref:hypothetical protein n=1 Tax=Succinimonas sp. TaxID=1936151 RepID=UPI003865A168